MESIIQKLEGKYFAYVATIYLVDGAYCSHAYYEYKPRYFKTEKGAYKSTQRFIDLNSHLYNVFMQERMDVEDSKQ